ncbi:hypothetical protein EXIGLDRAFT_735178 [Exidia glandulosa HHB12029]|uniref:SnoaL-like domain-containing protein n=1 Tax=Exidia glandulosa HHB12029 TaxID=1314781 RepID=A0A165ATE2_EXIGL|nr:hypothetical protein EXIGLDRAFT_735178 [Exidia glandulosa HHB12029]
MMFPRAAALALFAGASLVSAAVIPRADDAVAAVTNFLTAYSNMDYDALKAAATPDFHFQDQAFPKLHPGSMSLGMFHWFISDQSNTNMKVTFDPSTITFNSSDGTITAHYVADYDFDAGFGSKNHVVNPITATYTVVDGLVKDEKDTYDLGFSGWAEQALGPTLGPLLKDSAATLPFIQVAGAGKLGLFLLTHSS